MDFQENENNIQELLSIFQVESEEILEKIFDNLLSFESNPTDKELCATLYRELHSLKGAVRMAGFNNVQNSHIYSSLTSTSQTASARILDIAGGTALPIILY